MGNIFGLQIMKRKKLSGIDSSFIVLTPQRTHGLCVICTVKVKSRYFIHSHVV